MPKLKEGTVFPTDEEEKAINNGIASDPDTYELSEAEFTQLRPVGRPPAERTKDRITIRLSSEVTEYFRNTGKDWQTRMDKILLEYVTTQIEYDALYVQECREHYA